MCEQCGEFAEMLNKSHSTIEHLLVERGKLRQKIEAMINWTDKEIKELKGVPITELIKTWKSESVSWTVGTYWALTELQNFIKGVDMVGSKKTEVMSPMGRGLSSAHPPNRPPQNQPSQPSENDEWIIKCRCGEKFDLRYAPWCEHSPVATKLCPKGHCICHLLNQEEKFRPATDHELALGFEFMLKEEYGGVQEKLSKGGA